MSPSHLIVVCGHAIWLGGPKNGWDEAEWLIEDWKRGETPTFIQHIQAGVRLLGQDEDSALVFSGGPTWPSTRLSEARSYYNLAAANHFFNLLPSPPASDTGDPIAILTPTDPAPPTSSRILLEERALDSYYNILFSLVAFWRACSVWPRRLTIVSHGFKRVRLVEGHCQAIGFPLDRIDFVGINPPGVDDDVGAALTCAAGSSGEGGAGRDLVGEEKKEVMKGVQLTLGQWKDDPHGVGEDLAGKRRKRNCWGVDQRLFLSEEERERSGVDVRTLEDGSEALVEGGRRPWADE